MHHAPHDHPEPETTNYSGDYGRPVRPFVAIHNPYGPGSGRRDAAQYVRQQSLLMSKNRRIVLDGDDAPPKQRLWQSPPVDKSAAPAAVFSAIAKAPS